MLPRSPRIAAGRTGQRPQLNERLGAVNGGPVIHGIGTDVVDASDVEASLARFGRRYRDRMFTPDEQAWASRRPGSARWAEAVAAKEAVFKALRVPESVSAPWSDVEVRPAGAVRLAGPIGEWAAAHGVTNVSVQTSALAGASDRSTVLALAVCEAVPPTQSPEQATEGSR